MSAPRAKAEGNLPTMTQGAFHRIINMGIANKEAMEEVMKKVEGHNLSVDVLTTRFNSFIYWLNDATVDTVDKNHKDTKRNLGRLGRNLARLIQKIDEYEHVEDKGINSMQAAIKHTVGSIFVDIENIAGTIEEIPSPKPKHKTKVQGSGRPSNYYNEEANVKYGSAAPAQDEGYTSFGDACQPGWQAKWGMKGSQSFADYLEVTKSRYQNAEQSSNSSDEDVALNAKYPPLTPDQQARIEEWGADVAASGTEQPTTPYFSASQAHRHAKRHQEAKKRERELSEKPKRLEDDQASIVAQVQMNEAEMSHQELNQPKKNKVATYNRKYNGKILKLIEEEEKRKAASELAKLTPEFEAKREAFKKTVHAKAAEAEEYDYVEDWDENLDSVFADYDRLSTIPETDADEEEDQEWVPIDA
ncbi:hypothetical protein BDW74DRAFT_178079 [Aspergillus multicolor]|uniref:uncharacterized protein n=1 Tax=Aspergillus multicolor TaxID=41759 RepID=UPI003CCDD4E3